MSRCLPVLPPLLAPLWDRCHAGTNFLHSTVTDFGVCRGLPFAGNRAPLGTKHRTKKQQVAPRSRGATQRQWQRTI